MRPDVHAIFQVLWPSNLYIKSTKRSDEEPNAIQLLIQSLLYARASDHHCSVFSVRILSFLIPLLSFVKLIESRILLCKNGTLGGPNIRKNGEWKCEKAKKEEDVLLLHLLAYFLLAHQLNFRGEVFPYLIPLPLVVWFVTW